MSQLDKPDEITPREAEIIDLADLISQQAARIGQMVHEHVPQALVVAELERLVRDVMILRLWIEVP